MDKKEKGELIIGFVFLLSLIAFSFFAGYAISKWQLARSIAPLEQRVMMCIPR